MYKLHLILKYLRKRRIAWVSLIAVMLCTAMVLIVMSVMGGWIRMFRASFHGLSGDVIVQGRSVVGFPHYQEMIDQIEKLPEVAAAVPTIHSFGLANISNSLRKPVQVFGYPIKDIGKINTFPQSLHRQWEREKKPAPSFDLLPNVDYETWVPRGSSDPKRWPGMIVGGGVVGISKNEDGTWWRPQHLYEAWVRLTVVQVSPDSSRVDLKSDQRETMFWIVDDSRTGIYQQDSAAVYIDFDILQRDLGMEESRYTDPETGELRTDPARTSTIQVNVKDGIDLNLARDKINQVVQAILVRHNVSPAFPVEVETWEDSQRTWLDAIENEKSLVTVLFGIISIVAVFLILCIFYMIVVEKTKDIGVIKSVGASPAGVAGIFVGYGLAIGIVGAIGGVLLGTVFVHYINDLHHAFARLTGHQIWNPAVYAFDTIPNTVNPWEAAAIGSIAVVASVVGAIVPAAIAGQMRPVEALRWE